MALRSARRGLGFVSPNPMVGAVIVSEGEVVGRGWHRRAGGDHAETQALKQAGVRAVGSAVYINLEPCAHHANTPPCTKALIGAGVAKVFAAMQDPDPRVNGRGIDELRASGIEVEMGLLGEEAARLNAAYTVHRTEKRPLVTYKVAVTLDGRSAALDGSSKWITGEAARRDVQRLRAASDAVCVGVGTVLADDPELAVRGVPKSRSPLRVVMDSTARTPPESRVISDAAPTLILTGQEAAADRVDALRTAGAEVVEVAGKGSRVPIMPALELLAGRGVLALLLEGGATLGGAFAEAGAVDRYRVYIAPKLLGGNGAPGVIGGWSSSSIHSAARLRITGVRRLGPDIRIDAEPEER